MKNAKLWNYLIFFIIFTAITGGLPVILRIFLSESQVNNLLIYISVAIELLLIAPVACILLKKEKYDFANLKLPKFNILNVLKITAYSIIIFAAARLISDGAKWIAYATYLEWFQLDVSEPISAGKFIYLVVFLALVPAFCEELFYRVYGFEATKKYSFGIRLTLLTATFVLAHVFSGIYTMLSVLMLSVFIIIIYEKTKSFYAVTSIHAIYNILSLLFSTVLYLPTDITNIIYLATNTERIFMGLIFIAAALAVFTVALLLALNSGKPKKIKSAAAANKTSITESDESNPS